MADPVAFIGVEEQHLFRLGYRLLVRKIAQEDSTVRKYQLRCRCALLRTHGLT